MVLCFHRLARRQLLKVGVGMGGTADSSYASAVPPIGNYEVMDARDGYENGDREEWAFSPVAASSPSV